MWNIETQGNWDRLGNYLNGGEGEPGQGGKGLGACSFHDGGAVVFHRALTDMEVGGDILAGMTSQNHIHDFPLPRG